MGKYFKRALMVVVNRRYGGIKNKLATDASVDRGLLNHLLTGKRSPAPATVGQIARKLDDAEAQAIIAAYLADVADAVRKSAGIGPGAAESNLHQIASELTDD